MTGPSKLATHEAGHIVVAWLCGRRLGPATIVRAGLWAGSAHVGAAPSVPRDDLDRLDPERPVALWPARLRRQLEVLALTFAAGRMAEEVFYYPQHTGRPGDAVTEEAVELAKLAVPAAPVPLSRSERVRVAAERPHDPTDAEHLAELASALYDDLGPRGTWLAHIGEEAKSLLRAHPGPVLRVAAALDEHGRLSGAAVRALVGGAR